jgi:hypothetical protein
MPLKRFARYVFQSLSEDMLSVRPLETRYGDRQSWQPSAVSAGRLSTRIQAFLDRRRAATFYRLLSTRI